MFDFFFNPMSIDEAFELLINNTMTPKEYKHASRKINHLRENDWRLWFGRFLLFIRSGTDTHRFTDAFICLEITREVIQEHYNPMEQMRFLSLVNSEALFLAYKFYFEVTGLPATALLLARSYQNGWGVQKNLKKAYRLAKFAARTKHDELYPAAKELVDEIVFEHSRTVQANKPKQIPQTNNKSGVKHPAAAQNANRPNPKRTANQRTTPQQPNRSNSANQSFGSNQFFGGQPINRQSHTQGFNQFHGNPQAQANRTVPEQSFSRFYDEQRMSGANQSPDFTPFYGGHQSKKQSYNYGFNQFQGGQPMNGLNQRPSFDRFSDRKRFGRFGKKNSFDEFYNGW